MQLATVTDTTSCPRLNHDLAEPVDLMKVKKQNSCKVTTTFLAHWLDLSHVQDMESKKEELNKVQQMVYV